MTDCDAGASRNPRNVGGHARAAISPIHFIVKSEPLMTSHVWGKTIELLGKLEVDDAQLRYC